MLDLRRNHPNLTDGEIADKIGIARPTFNRLKNDRGNLPSMDNMIKLMKGSHNEKLIGEVISLLNEEMGTMLAKNNASAHPAENKILEDYELESLFQDHNVFIAYELSSIPEGTTEKQLKRILGAKGIKAINLLAKKGIVYPRGKRFFVRNQGLLVRNHKSIKEQIGLYVKYYKPDYFGKAGNYVYSASSGLNEMGLQAARDLMCETYQKIKNIYRNPKFQGRFFSFVGGFCGLLDHEDFEQSRDR